MTHNLLCVTQSPDTFVPTQQWLSFWPLNQDTQLLTSRKCGAFRVNEHFHVGRAGLTAGGWGGGRPLRHSEGFSMFLWWWEYCSAVISLAHCATRISLLFWLLHFFLFESCFGVVVFFIVYCQWYLWNISTYQSVSWWHLILPPWNPPSLFLTTDIKFSEALVSL